MNYKHIPVLLDETINILNINPNGIYIDGTAGGGGHSEAIRKKLINGKLICMDRDPDAIQVLNEKFRNDNNVTVKQANFCDVKQIIHELSIDQVDGFLLDLGVSSYQLDQAERGFSYNQNSLLDMRMSKQGLSAYDLVNTLDVSELTKIIKKFGEEKYAKSIAYGIVKYRTQKFIKTTFELNQIIKKSIPERQTKKKKHPSKKTFQALRIAVNDELNNLSDGLSLGFSILKPGGIIAVITFHSIEDRIVKNKMHYWTKSCICPKDFPVCVCGKVIQGKVINKKAIRATEKEILNNPRSRSATLRAFMKI